MKASIKSIELNKLLNRNYLKVKMESQHNEYVLSNPLMSDPINFRKQLFGLLTACDCYDLMNLGRSESTPFEATGYYFEDRGYKILENNNGQWLSINEKTGRYSCKNADEYTKSLIKMAIENKISNVEIHEGSITSVRSGSGTFMTLFENKDAGASFFVTGQVYWGFGSPINIGNKATESEKLDSAKMFTSFITSLMEFFGEDDLLKLGGDVEKYPEVEITLNNSNKISAVTNVNTGLGFSIGRNYEIIDSPRSKSYEKLD